MLANDNRPRTMHPEAERTGREPPTSDTPPSAAWTARLRPLQLAIWNSYEGSGPIVRLLVARGARVEGLDDYETKLLKEKTR